MSWTEIGRLCGLPIRCKRPVSPEEVADSISKRGDLVFSALLIDGKVREFAFLIQESIAHKERGAIP